LKTRPYRFLFGYLNSLRPIAVSIIATIPTTKPHKKNVKLQKKAAIEPARANPQDLLIMLEIPPATASTAMIHTGIARPKNKVATQAGVLGIILETPPAMNRITTTHKAHTPAIISKMPAVVDRHVLCIPEPPAILIVTSPL
jgi:hypothetical protein